MLEYYGIFGMAEALANCQIAFVQFNGFDVLFVLGWQKGAS